MSSPNESDVTVPAQHLVVLSHGHEIWVTRDLSDSSHRALLSSVPPSSSVIMHNLFEIAELLHPIIGCLNREDQIACAQVCQSWSEVALDVLWYKVESLARVANALAPVRLKSEGRERAYVSFYTS